MIPARNNLTLIERRMGVMSGRRCVAQASQPVHPSHWLRCGGRGFSLIELLIAMTLMSVIVLGLMAMFGETQRAFRAGITQVDVMESGRTALEMMAREIEQAEATDMPGSINFNVGSNPYGYAPAALQPYRLLQSLPGTTLLRTNIFQDVLFLTREGQRWTAIGYAVVYSNYIGTLYRYETNASVLQPNAQFIASAGYNTFFGPNPAAANPSRVMDGVVDLRFHVYDHLGQLINPDYNLRYPSMPLLNADLVITAPGGRGGDAEVRFFSNALPAYVEIELGILEAKTAERARNLPDAAQGAFLEKQAGKVQVFRQRVPIRNVDPSVYQ